MDCLPTAGTAFAFLQGMKQIIIQLSFCCILFSACGQSSNDKTGKTNGGGGDKEEKKVTKRDLSITKANAYNDLFIDSNTVQNYIKTNKLPDSISRRMISFYNARNYQYAWFSSNGLTEQTRAFWNLHDYYTTYVNDSAWKDKKFQKRMDALAASENLSVSAGDKSYQSIELTLTEHFIEYTLKNFEKGYVKRKEMERFIPLKKQDQMAYADSILTKKHKDDKYFEDVNENYGKLKQALQRYYDIAKK